jgi:hypothetical protein
MAELAADDSIQSIRSAVIFDVPAARVYCAFWLSNIFHNVSAVAR